MPRIRTLLVALAIGAASAASALGLPLVAIDPGHGGADSGAVGSLPAGTVTGLTPRADAAGNPLIFEKDVNLDVGQRLSAFLQANGVPTLMTRNTDSAGGDVPYVSEGADLKARTDLANAQAAQLFVSIHQNSAFSALATGTETYVLTGLPGSVMIGTPSMRPKPWGMPGFIATFVNSTPPRAVRTSFTVS